MWDLSSQTRDWTWIPFIGRWILNHREVAVILPRRTTSFSSGPTQWQHPGRKCIKVLGPGCGHFLTLWGHRTPKSCSGKVWVGSLHSVLYVEAGLTPLEQISPRKRKRQTHTDKAVLEASGTCLIRPSSALLKGVPRFTHLSWFISWQSHKAGIHCLSKPRSRLFLKSSFMW